MTPLYTTRKLDSRFRLHRQHGFELVLVWNLNLDSVSHPQQHNYRTQAIRFTDTARRVLGTEHWNSRYSAWSHQGRWSSETVQRGRQWNSWRTHERRLYLKSSRELTLLLLAVA